MKKIYLIAQDELVVSFGETVSEARACHNLGAFTNEGEAQKVADRHNKLMQDTDESESYYVLGIPLK